MTNAPIRLQDLRKRIYIKAKAEPEWRFWGLYVHVCKRETLQEAYRLAKANNGAPGSDGVTFAAIEAGGVEGFLEQIREELVSFRYRPLAVRKKEIPKDGGKKVRVLSIPAIRPSAPPPPRYRDARTAVALDGGPLSFPKVFRTSIVQRRRNCPVCCRLTPLSLVSQPAREGAGGTVPPPPAAWADIHLRELPTRAVHED